MRRRLPDQVSGRLYVGRSNRGFYYTAIVFRDKEMMHSWWKKRSRTVSHRAKGAERRGASTFEAQATWWKTIRRMNSRWRRGKNCGVIIFHRGRMGAGIVSHEMTHAALYYVAYQRKLDPLKSKYSDELLAWTQGWLTTQFWKWYYANVEPA